MSRLISTAAIAARFDRNAVRGDRSSLWPTIGVLALALVLLNGSFLAIRVGGSFLPKAPIAEQVQRGLRLGVLSTEDYPGNYLLGIDQYTDCVALELALTPSSAVLEQALAPRVLSLPDVPGRCATLADFVSGKFRSDEVYRYTRFWHGYATVTAAALQVFPLRAYRGLLTMLCYGAIAFAAACAAFAARRTVLALLPLFVGSFAFSEIDQLGASLSHAPAFVALWAFAGVILLFRERLSFAGLLTIVLCMGATEAFLDSMILCPLSAALALIAAGCAREDRIGTGGWQRALGFYAAVLGAWCLGFLGTYLCKLAFTIAILGVDPVIVPFVQQLRLRMAPGPQQPGSYLGALYSNLWRMSYGDAVPQAAALGLLTVGGLGWLCALGRAGIARRRGAGWAGFVEGAGFVAATLVVLAWFTLFREHTWRHAFFMVRVTIIGLTAGWCWWLAQSADRRGARSLLSRRSVCASRRAQAS